LSGLIERNTFPWETHKSLGSKSRFHRLPGWRVDHGACAISRKASPELRGRTSRSRDDTLSNHFANLLTSPARACSKACLPAPLEVTASNWSMIPMRMLIWSLVQTTFGTVVDKIWLP